MSNLLFKINLLKDIIIKRKWGFIPFIFYEFYFDKKYQIKTGGLMLLKDLNIPNASKVFAKDYMPSNYYIFKKSLKRIPEEIKHETFIDFGCGKGRVLLMAAESGFKKIVGIDFSDDLIKICLKNLEVYRNKNSCEFEVICVDALLYSIPKNATLFYFYNPFWPEVFSQIVSKIVESIKANPREAYVIYINPLYSELFDVKNFEKIDEYKDDFKIYKIRS
ncbi:MAG: class I SAM-dependent methyltransferase [Bacteriovoracaceae bacterium]